MIQKTKCLVMDIDGTLCPVKRAGQDYADLQPFPEMCARLREYKRAGFYVILNTSRNMNTFDGNLGKINANTAKVLLAWLDQHDIPYDEIHYGKPWPGEGGFYVDDRTVRPKEFLSMSYEQLLALVSEK